MYLELRDRMRETSYYLTEKGLVLGKEIIASTGNDKVSPGDLRKIPYVFGSTAMEVILKEIHPQFKNLEEAAMYGAFEVNFFDWSPDDLIVTNQVVVVARYAVIWNRLYRDYSFQRIV